MPSAHTSKKHGKTYKEFNLKRSINNMTKVTKTKDKKDASCAFYISKFSNFKIPYKFI